jgi:hypothetical protein
LRTSSAYIPRRAELAGRRSPCGGQGRSRAARLNMTSRP